MKNQANWNFPALCDVTYLYICHIRIFPVPLFVQYLLFRTYMRSVLISALWFSKFWFFFHQENCFKKMASRKTNKKGTKKRAQRATSNVFAMFGQDQIQVKPFSCFLIFVFSSLWLLILIINIYYGRNSKRLSIWSTRIAMVLLIKKICMICLPHSEKVIFFNLFLKNM